MTLMMDKHRFFLSAWGISLTLHGMVVGLALAFVAQVKPVLQEDMFQWNVALVQEASPDSKSELVKSAKALEQPPAKQALPPQIKRVSEISQTVTPIERTIEPPRQTFETAHSIERKVQSPQVREEPVEQSRAEITPPTSEPVAVAALSEPVESHPVQQESVAAAPPSSLETPVAQEAPAPVSPQDNRVDAAPVQVAKAAGLSAEAKLDHRWLAESLWRRVAELKRYPNSARMNGQEGKVILKAVIRSDGQLADVFVQKSSGYSELDAAAIEAVKLACPLYMKHAIGKPQIVVSLPIVYSLAN